MHGWATLMVSELALGKLDWAKDHRPLLDMSWFKIECKINNKFVDGEDGEQEKLR